MVHSLGHAIRKRREGLRHSGQMLVHPFDPVAAGAQQIWGGCDQGQDAVFSFAVKRHYFAAVDCTEAITSPMASNIFA